VIFGGGIALDLCEKESKRGFGFGVVWGVLGV
jgi:hypothetical protein